MNIYCSKECLNVAWGKKPNKPKVKKCKYCGSEFNPYTSLDKFCSAKCRIDNMKSKRSFQWSDESIKKRIGKNNPAYRNGCYTRDYKKRNKGERIFIANRRKIKKSMVDEVGYIYCQNCNNSRSIRYEGHHLIYRSEKPLHENLHDIDNIIILCIECHNEFHKHKSLRNEIVRARKLNILFGDDILDK